MEYQTVVERKSFESFSPLLPKRKKEEEDDDSTRRGGRGRENRRTNNGTGCLLTWYDTIGWLRKRKHGIMPYTRGQTISLNLRQKYVLVEDSKKGIRSVCSSFGRTKIFKKQTKVIFRYLLTPFPLYYIIPLSYYVFSTYRIVVISLRTRHYDFSSISTTLCVPIAVWGGRG